MDRIIEIDGKAVGFRATALTPRLYRHKIGRDIIQDINGLRKSLKRATSLPADATEEEKRDAQLSALDLEIFENMAWVMARQYDANVPNSPDEWLDGFETFSVYSVLPGLLELWANNEQVTAMPKKK